MLARSPAVWCCLGVWLVVSLCLLPTALAVPTPLPTYLSTTAAVVNQQVTVTVRTNGDPTYRVYGQLDAEPPDFPGNFISIPRCGFDLQCAGTPCDSVYDFGDINAMRDTAASDPCLKSCTATSIADNPSGYTCYEGFLSVFAAQTP
jgi:hypothetical protein